jgi:hypothetical protein
VNYDKDWAWEIRSEGCEEEAEYLLMKEIWAGKTLNEAIVSIVEKTNNDTILYPIAYLQIANQGKIAGKLKNKVLEMVARDIASGGGTFGDYIVIYEEFKEHVENATAY